MEDAPEKTGGSSKRHDGHRFNSFLTVNPRLLRIDAENARNNTMSQVTRHHATSLMVHLAAIVARMGIRVCTRDRWVTRRGFFDSWSSVTVPSLDALDVFQKPLI